MELIGCKLACGNSEGVGTDRLAACHIAGCVADHKNAVGRELFSGLGLGSAFGVGREFIAVVIIIGEGTESEVVRDLVVIEFEVGTFLEIACEEALHEVGACGDGFEGLDDARIEATVFLAAG